MGDEAAAGKHAWAEPGCYLVTDGVYRVPLPLPNDALRAVNVYILADGEGWTLVDSGWSIDTARTQLMDGLGRVGAEITDVGRFLITHAHRDHYNQAVVLRREFGIPLALGAGELPTLEALRGAEMPLAKQVELLRATGATRLVEELLQFVGAEGVDPDEYPFPDRWLAEGDTLTVGERTFDVHETPGHTRGHVVFRDATNGLLFAGDHILPHITPSIAFEAQPPTLPLQDFLNSLRRIRALPDTWLLPAHGPVLGTVHERVDELLEHHRNRLEIIHDTIRAGATTAAESAAKLTWTRRERALSDLDTFNATLAVLETKAHLDVLADRREIQAEQTAGVWYFRCR